MATAYGANDGRLATGATIKPSVADRSHQAGAPDLEGRAPAGAAQATETPTIAGNERQRLFAAQGDTSQPRVELSPLTERTEDGRQLRILVVIDEFTRECLAIEVARSFTARDVIMTLQYLFAVRGAPEHLRIDNGPEFVAKEIQEWLGRAGVRALDIQKAIPWENGYVESFDGRLRDELLDRELFLSLTKARVFLDQWRIDCNHRRPHGGLNWMTPAAFVAGLDDTTTGAVPAASLGVSPVGATPRPPTHQADWSLTLS